jgi:hypothetical protein
MRFPIDERSKLNPATADSGGAGAAVSITLAAAADACHVIRKIVASFSAAPAAVVNLTVTAAGVTIFKAVLPIVAGIAGQFDFESDMALTNNKLNEEVVVTIAAPGGAVVATLSIISQ